MAFSVVIENRAQKEFRKIPLPFNRAIRKSIDALELNPRPHGCKKLVASPDGHRVRIGDYRVLYTIDDRKSIVTIYRIRHRKDAYD
ncbi:MAG: type II toxin-antitoxin system RelE/ParE family toxin [Fibrobacterota bacterium]